MDEEIRLKNSKWNKFQRHDELPQDKKNLMKLKNLSLKKLTSEAKPFSTILMYPELTKKQLKGMDKRRSASNCFIPFRKVLEDLKEQ